MAFDASVEPTAEQLTEVEKEFGLTEADPSKANTSEVEAADGTKGEPQGSAPGSDSPDATPAEEEVPYSPLDPEKVYHSADYLTLQTEEGEKTLKVGVWVYHDPIRLHKLIVREKSLHVDEYEVLHPLESKLRRADPDYFKHFMGLKLVIDYPGYSTGIMAKIPFEIDPVGFYKWWRKGKHEDKVYLNLPNQIRLIQKVSLMDKKVLLKKDLDLLA